MPSVYIETSIVSYLTARPSQSLLVAAWQDVTVTWWSYQRQDFDLCTSALVIEEASRGDQEAAGRRIAHLEGIPLLPVSDQVIEFARRLVHPGPLPVEAADDAFHVALSAVHAVDYLLTWNFKHIDNALIKPQFRAICLKHGYPSPESVPPRRWSEVCPMKDEVIVALWKIKEEIAREHEYDVDRLGAMVREKEREYAYRVVDRARSKKSDTCQDSGDS